MTTYAVLCGLDPGPLSGTVGARELYFGCAWLWSTRTFNMSRTSCGAAVPKPAVVREDQTWGVVETQQRLWLDKPIILPAILYSLQEVYRSHKPLELWKSIIRFKAHRTISHEFIWYVCSCNTQSVFRNSEIRPCSHWPDFNGIFSNYTKISQNQLYIMI